MSCKTQTALTLELVEDASLRSSVGRDSLYIREGSPFRVFVRDARASGKANAEGVGARMAKETRARERGNGERIPSRVECKFVLGVVIYRSSGSCG